MLVYKPHRGRRNGLSITEADVRRLAEGQYLNDTLIEFGLKYVSVCSDTAYIVFLNFSQARFGCSE